MPDTLSVIPVHGLPRIRKGADLAKCILRACEEEHTHLRRGDVVVVAQKIVSKAEGRSVDLRKVKPSAFAREYAERYEKDARIVEVVLRETKRVSRMDRGAMICETPHGFVCANAGVDHSNVGADDRVLLLPEDPDASAADLRDRLERAAGVRLAVIITDTWGRPWRTGLCEFAIGVSGLNPLLDFRGKPDYFGGMLEHTIVAVADELASAAGLVMGKDAGVPVAIVRGFRYRRSLRATAKPLLRDPSEDLYR